MIPQTRWARAIDGAYIAYQDFGDGPPLVVIHGWVSHLEVYWEQPRFARFMRRLATGMRVLHFDKRGTGMSDRIAHSPDLETRMDDVRAVMDAASVQRAAILGWGSGGPMLAVLFAATYPERTTALCLDGVVRLRWAPDYPWGYTDEEEDRDMESMLSAWGTEEGAAEFLRQGLAQPAQASPSDDKEFLSWTAKFARYAATPGSYEAFDRMWFETDVRGVLPAVRVPTIVLFDPDDPEDQAQAEYTAARIPGAKVVAAVGAGVPWVGEPDHYISEVERFLASVREEEESLDRVLSTVLFTDIAGSTERAAEIGDRAWRDLVERHHATVRAMLSRYRGIEVDTAGDGFFATFDGPARAVRCAHACIEAVRTLGIEIRAGVHTGEIQMIGGKAGGIAVNIGARVGSAAAPSEVLVSRTVKDLTAGSGLAFEDRGEHELKGVPGKWRIYSLVSGKPGSRWPSSTTATPRGNSPTLSG